MNSYSFKKEKIRFFTKENSSYPDAIEISIVHDDYSPANKEDIANGTLLFLDNAIGELKMITQVDSIEFVAAPKGVELIPIEKLNDYLLWREKEFVEKYDDVRYDSSKDEYSIYEAEDNDHNLVLAVINRQLLHWKNKVSHPWVMTVRIKYKGDDNGMPDKATYLTMNELEDELQQTLTNSDGYLYLGRETYKNERAVYIACREFRNSSCITAGILNKFSGRLNVDYMLFKDKYWKVLNRFF